MLAEQQVTAASKEKVLDTLGEAASKLLLPPLRMLITVTFSTPTGVSTH